MIRITEITSEQYSVLGSLQLFARASVDGVKVKVELQSDTTYKVLELIQDDVRRQLKDFQDKLDG